MANAITGPKAQFKTKKDHIVSLTDSSSGTAADTIAAIGATYDQDEVRNAVASLAAKINALILVVENAELTKLS